MCRPPAEILIAMNCIYEGCFLLTIKSSYKKKQFTDNSSFLELHVFPCLLLHTSPIPIRKYFQELMHRHRGLTDWFKKNWTKFNTQLQSLFKSSYIL